MVLCVRHSLHIRLCAAALFLALFSILGPLQVSRGETAQAEKTETAQAKKDFPGINEIVPRGTIIAARIADAEALIQKAEAMDAVSRNLDLLGTRLEKLEERYSNWENIKNWRFNRLRSAQSNYADLNKELKVQLNIISTQFQNLENLCSTWGEEKTYWMDWYDFLSKTHAKFPEEPFEGTLTSIDTLLEQTAGATAKLIKAQQKYAPAQETITRRLKIINKTLNSIKQETFRRNTFSLFEPGYYRQFGRELFTDIIDSQATTLRSSTGYLREHGRIVGLQVIFIIFITLLLANRRKQSRAIAEEWSFIFQRPLAGATFINIIVIGNFTRYYTNLPLGWRWLLIVIMTIAAIRLVNPLYKGAVEKKAIKIIAAIFIVTESLQTFGTPEPLLQLYDVFLCAAAIFLCRNLMSRKFEELSKHRFLLYLVMGIAFVGLATSLLGFERFASMLILSTLSTFIFLLIIRIALHVVCGGVESFIQLEWVRNRAFMQVLGLQQATRKLQSLSKIIILVNGTLVLLVIWRIFDHSQDAVDAIMGYEFTFGELALSVKMVALVIVILYLTVIISWVIQAFVDSQIMTPRKMELGIKESLKRLVHYGLFTFGFLVAVSIAGLDLQKITILVGAFGVGIGFGLQNIVNNFVSGLILLFERPVKVGDIINIDQEWGTITRIGLRSTVFETFDNSEVIVPNADLIAQKVTNWTFSNKMARVVLPVGVIYGSPLEKVLEILNKAAKEHTEVLLNPAPNSIFEGFGNSSIDFKLRFWVRNIEERLRIRTEVALIIDRLFREEDIVIAFPQLDLHLRSIDSDVQTLWGEKSSKIRNAKEKIPE